MLNVNDGGVEDQLLVHSKGDERPHVFKWESGKSGKGEGEGEGEEARRGGGEKGGREGGEEGRGEEGSGAIEKHSSFIRDTRMGTCHACKSEREREIKE